MGTGAREVLTTGDVRRRLEELAPPGLAESWDNVGWQVGEDGLAVNAISVTLDVDQQVVEEALERGANVIIAHHPILLRGLKHIDPMAYQGHLLRGLLCNGIYVYAAHTNLDAVPDGVNGALAAVLGLAPEGPLLPIPGVRERAGFGARCTIDSVRLDDMIEVVRAHLGARQIRVTPGIGGPPVHSRVALMGGSGASMIEHALRAGCSLYITGEMKYHDAQDAARAGLTVIEVGHYQSERPVLERVVEWLRPLAVPVYESKIATLPYDVE